MEQERKFREPGGSSDEIVEQKIDGDSVEDDGEGNSGLGAEFEGNGDFPVKEMDLGTLLELKKKQLLGSAGGEAQSIDVDEQKSCKEVKELELNGGGNGGNGSECGNDMGFVGFAEDGVRNTNPELDGKKGKRSRRRGKGARNAEKNLTHINEAELGFQGNGDRTKIMYSREEMEVLRFSKVVEQQEMWKKVYNGLGTAVAMEYDDLGCVRRHQKQFGVDFDPRQNFPATLGEMSSENKDHDSENVKRNGTDCVNTLDPACSESIGDENGYTDLEDNCIEDYDSEEDYGSIHKPALMVDGEPNFDSGPVEDGFEYIRRVRWEAAHIPKVKVAKLDRSKLNKKQTVYMPRIEDIAKCPEHLLPLKQWEEAFLADFSQLRLAFSRLDESSVKTSENSHQLLDDAILESNYLRSHKAYSSDNLNSNSKTSVDETSGNHPKLSTLLRLEPVTRISMLRKHISAAVENTRSLSRDDCLWLFALCAAVDTPLDADTCADLRSLLRKCARLRAEKREQDDELVMLNILIAVSGRYFGQLE